jgi:hypothetical protein
MMINLFLIPMKSLLQMKAATPILNQTPLYEIIFFISSLR